VESLIEYLRLMESRVKKYDKKFPVDLMMTEVAKIATENWVNEGVPDLTEEQLDTVFLKIITLN
jgi:hypothetical protein